MRIHIAPNKRIGDVQREFNEQFPFLKIEFYTNRVYQQPDGPTSTMMPENKRIGDIQLAISDGYIDIDPGTKVYELEKKFKDDFGLVVQVFRRSGNLWLQTTVTDKWTLEHQNNYGKEITDEQTQKPITEDFDLTRDSDH